MCPPKMPTGFNIEHSLDSEKPLVLCLADGHKISMTLADAKSLGFWLSICDQMKKFQ